MPVVLAAAEAMCDEPYNLHGSATSTGGSATLLIVNGPVAKELGINSGANLFGPGNRANATIGRALRLFLMNVCGVIPGTLDRSTMGHPGKYTYCIAENEADSPWPPYHVDNGFPADTSTVTVMPMLGPFQVWNNSGNTAKNVLTSFASGIASLGCYGLGSSNGLKFCVVIINDEHRAVIARDGWSKGQVKEFLFERGRRSVAELKRWGLIPGAVQSGDDDKILDPVSSPSHIIVIAAGGGGVFSACIPPWSAGSSTSPVMRAIPAAG
jgi:hypothetical protein